MLSLDSFAYLQLLRRLLWRRQAFQFHTLFLHRRHSPIAARRRLKILRSQWPGHADAKLLRKQSRRQRKAAQRQRLWVALLLQNSKSIEDRD